MKNDVTKTAALRALFLLVIIESAVAFLYFGTNNPEIFPFLVALSVAGVLAAAWIFTFVRAPETTRLKWYPFIFLCGAILGVLFCCSSIVLLIIGAFQGKIEWMAATQIPLGVYMTVYFWSKRQAALKSNFGAP